MKQIKTEDFDETPEDRSMLEKINDAINSGESVREMFSSKNIKMKSDLTEDQISAISRLIPFAIRIKKELGITILFDCLNEFIELRVSLDRKSRPEYVDIHQRLQQIQNPQQTGFNPLNPNLKQR